MRLKAVVTASVVRHGVQYHAGGHPHWNGSTLRDGWQDHQHRLAQFISLGRTCTTCRPRTFMLVFWPYYRAISVNMIISPATERVCLLRYYSYQRMVWVNMKSPANVVQICAAKKEYMWWLGWRWTSVCVCVCVCHWKAFFSCHPGSRTPMRKCVFCAPFAQEGQALKRQKNYIPSLTSSP